jgi:TatD DNase family protein
VKGVENLFIDTHAHIDDKAFASTSTDELIRNADAAKVKHIIAPAVDLNTSINLRNIAEKYPQILFAAGFHCHEASEFSEDNIEMFKKLLQHEKCVAVGEIGLDYHYNFSPSDVQVEVLKTFLDLAVLIKKPVILHCREAEEDLLNILKLYGNKIKGVVHCYTGSEKYALEFVKLGFYIGFTGIITFKKCDEIREVVASIPADRILAETDSPYMTPVPYRGKRNEPAYLPFVAAEIAKIKQLSSDAMQQILVKNASECFGYRFYTDEF